MYAIGRQQSLLGSVQSRCVTCWHGSGVRASHCIVVVAPNRVSLRNSCLWKCMSRFYNLRCGVINSLLNLQTTVTP